MSDYSISIVPRLSNYPDKEIKAKEILDWLISLEIVKAIPSDCILGEGNGYGISQGAVKVVTLPKELPFELSVNGLEITTERTVFDTGENFTEQLICPNCQEDIAFEDWDLESWTSEESDDLTCNACGDKSNIHSYTFEPQMGFSNLGFTFWNWPKLKTDFINSFKEKLNCEIDIVYRHL
jgi:hypothetical protein